MKLKLSDLHEIIKSRGDYQSRYLEYSLGKHFLPIYSIRKTKDFFLIWTSGSSCERERWEEVDIRVPVDSIVKVVGNVASLKLETKYLADTGCIFKKSVTLRMIVDF